MGGALVLLLAVIPSSQAGLPDDGGSSAFFVPLAGLAGAHPASPAAPDIASRPAVPVVAFRGLSIKGVQFSRSDRISVSLVAAIDRTEKTLLLSLYDLRLSEVAEALLRAKARGVDIRLVYDKGHVPLAEPGVSGGPSPEYQLLLGAGVPIRLLKGGSSFGIMHHKYAVFDGELLMTGSFNWTRAADDRNFENAVFTKDPAVIDGFTRNWDWMWALGRSPDATDQPAGDGFGSPPSDPLKPVSFAGGKYPRYVFSPQGGVADILVDALGRAKRSIDVAMFSFYSQDVADAVIAAAKRGVPVRVVSDASQSRRSQAILSLSKADVELRLSSGRDGTGVLHHKYMIIDGAFLVSGSYNFSQNAELYNFENDLITAGRGELAAFGGEFAVIWKQAHAPEPSELPVPKSL